MTSWPSLQKPPASTARHRLGSRQTFSRLLEEGEILTIRVLSGHLWVTLEGFPDDHLLTSGPGHCFSGPGLLVAEGIEAGGVFEIPNAAARMAASGSPPWKSASGFTRTAKATPACETSSAGKREPGAGNFSRRSAA